MKLVAIEGMGPPPDLMRRKERLPGPERFVDWVDDVRKLSGRSPRRYASIEDAFRRMQEENPHLTPEQARHLTVHGVSQNEDGTYSWKFDNYVRLQPPHGIRAADTVETWKRIHCPTLPCPGHRELGGGPDRGRAGASTSPTSTRRQRRGRRALGAPRPGGGVRADDPGVPRRLSGRVAGRTGTRSGTGTLSRYGG